MTPKCHSIWQKLSPQKRKIEIEVILDTEPRLEVIEAKMDGTIILGLKEPLKAAERGSLLREVERLLKVNIDIGLTVYLETKADKNSLRWFRGVKMEET